MIDQQAIEDRPLSYSSLKEFRKSPRHFVYYREERKYEASDAQIVGKATESFLLEPERMEKLYLPYTKFDRRSADAKDKWNEMLKNASENHLTMITNEDYARAKKAAESAKKNPEIVELLEYKRFSQKRFEWRERNVNLPILSIPDWDSMLPNGQLYGVEMKTTTCADPKTFARDIVKYWYHGQIATYSLAYHKCRFEFPEFVWVVVETNEPFGTAVIHISKREVQKAKEELLGLLTAFRRCLDEDKFDEDYRFWLFESRKYHSFYIPKYAMSNIMTPDEDDD